MKQEHTKEPWRINGLLVEVNGSGVMTPTICDCDASDIIPEEEQNANAHRFVACVNACEGIGNTYLEAFNLSNIIDDYQKIAKEKEELLGALMGEHCTVSLYRSQGKSIECHDGDCEVCKLIKKMKE